jgi:cell division protein ZapA (FtsZ GTPase activity inhibitor)
LRGYHRPVSRSVRVSVAGSTFSVRTDAKPKYVKELAAYVDSKLEEARSAGGGKSASTQKLALLAAMSISDELHQLREEHRRLRKEVRERSRRILKTLEKEANA